MKSLNKKLLLFLAILLVIAGSVSAISAYSDSGSGVIDDNPSGDNYTSASDVASEVYYDDASDVDNNSDQNPSDNQSEVHDDASASKEGSNSVSLSQYPTANPVLLLLGCVTLAGICCANRKS